MLFFCSVFTGLSFFFQFDDFCFEPYLIGFILLIPFTRKILFKLAFKNKSAPNIKKETDTIDGEVIDNKKDDS